MSRRVVIGGVAAAAVIAGTIGGIAVAHPSNTPTSAPGVSSPKSGAGPGLEADPGIARAAAYLGVSPERLMQALPAAKMASMNGGSLSSQAAANALAAELGVSPAKAEHALGDLFGAPAPGGAKAGSPQPPDQAITGLAAALHVSPQRARDVFDALDRMANPGHGVDPASPAFAALARSLDRTPAQLAEALDHWKSTLRSTMPGAPSPSPTAPSPTHS